MAWGEHCWYCDIKLNDSIQIQIDFLHVVFSSIHIHVLCTWVHFLSDTKQISKEFWTKYKMHMYMVYYLLKEWLLYILGVWGNNLGHMVHKK